eukprot:m.117182 g.117182  ORF g.117182 m.117182 type:complete len:398 (-) comp17183_c0_seq34:1627-2820(-)
MSFGAVWVVCIARTRSSPCKHPDTGAGTHTPPQCVCVCLPTGLQCVTSCVAIGITSLLWCSEQAYELGGMTQYALREASHLTESSALCTGKNTASLFQSWAPYWELDKDILVEKTPNHMVMSRLLQCFFGPQRTKFLFTLRHPLGATYFLWKLPRRVPGVLKDCGESFIKNWLAQMDILKTDIPHLRHARVMQFENFTVGDIQGNYNNVMLSMGLEPAFNVTSQKRDVRPSYSKMQEMARKRAQVKQAKGPGRVGALLDKRPPLPRRKLQGFLGNSENLVILVEPWFSWLDAWNERFADITKTPLCQDMWSKYEARVNEYGYRCVLPMCLRADGIGTSMCGLAALMMGKALVFLACAVSHWHALPLHSQPPPSDTRPPAPCVRSQRRPHPVVAAGNA